MTIQIDSREKARAIKKVLAEFDKQKVNHFVSKLYVGDYMSYDNPYLVIDRKQNLSEICSNVCQQHERFRNEIVRANEAGIKIIFLIEHGKGSETLEDIIWWENPRRYKRVKDRYGNYKDIETKAMNGETLYKILSTMKNKYDIDFEFCSKADTGKKIIDLLRCDN